MGPARVPDLDPDLGPDANPDIDTLCGRYAGTGVRKGKAREEGGGKRVELGKVRYGKVR